MGDVYSTQSKRSAESKPVGVVANSDPQSVRGFFLLWSLGCPLTLRIIGENGKAGKFSAAEQNRIHSNGRD
jgi:hypothetical protein